MHFIATFFTCRLSLGARLSFVAMLVWPQTGRPCAGTSGLVCVYNPDACLKSMVLAKAVPSVFLAPGNAPQTIDLPMTLFLVCPGTNGCGSACLSSAVPVSARLTATLVPCPPLPPGPPAPVLSNAISTVGMTMAVPACSSTGTFNAYVVRVTLPASHPAGVYCVTGEATVQFSDGLALTARGDTMLCLVEPASWSPRVPRLNLELITSSFPRVPPGDQATVRYRVTNNDPINAVRLTAFATSTQRAVRPQGANEAQGVFAISSPFGDDFPIVFDPGTNCIPLPPHPYTQPGIFKALPELGPGQSVEIVVALRSYGQCASGSCSESTLRVEGFFNNGTPALACAGMSVFADTSMPSSTCASAANDCNHNGIPDALDIAARRSADLNFNALPDECEAFINVPFFASVAPTNPLPGAPVSVRVAFNEAMPITKVWANGHPLIRVEFFGFPIWSNTVPADPLPGPASVTFTAVDTAGGLATFAALYTVIPPPSVRFLTIERSTNRFVHVIWSPPEATLLCTSNVPGGFAEVPGVTSPYAVDTRLAPKGFYRLGPSSSTRRVTIRLDGTVRPGGVVLDWSPRDWLLQESPNLLFWQTTPSVPPKGEYYRPAPFEPAPTPGAFQAGMRAFRTMAPEAGLNNQVFSVNAPGYFNFNFRVDETNLVTMPFPGPNPSLNSLLPFGGEAHGTVLYFFDAATQSFGPPITFVGGGIGWQDSTGASPRIDPARQLSCVLIPRNTLAGATTLTLTLVGDIPQGLFVRSLPPRLSLQGPLVPLSGGITSVHGLQPSEGDFVFLYNPISKLYDVYEFIGGYWEPTEPFLRYGDAFFYHNSRAVALNWVRELIFQ